MSNGRLAEYFEKRNAAWHKPIYEIGDRVRGFYEGIPFVGSVGVDGIRSLDEGPIVTVTLDLPIKVEGEVRTVLLVKHKDMGRANEFKFNFSGEKNDNKRKAKASPKTSRRATSSTR